MKPLVAYVINSSAKRFFKSAIDAGTRPCPEFIAFTRRYPSVLITYDDSRTISPGSWRRLQAVGLTHWSPPAVVFGSKADFTAVLAAAETVGLPLAIHAFNRRMSTPINIITHGFLYNEARALRSLAGYEGVKFLCLSETVRHILLERFGFPPSQIANTGHGVDTLFFSPSNQLDFPPLIVSAGAANRDYDILTRAVDSLPVTVFIAADSPWIAVDPLSLPTTLPSNVILRSSGDYVSLRNLYRRALFVVVPLKPVPFAAGYTVIAEAMAMGKAVIVTRTVCYSDCVIDGETGYFVSPGDVGDLRDKIRYLLDNPDKALKMGMRARAHVEESFSHDVYCKRLIHALRE